MSTAFDRIFGEIFPRLNVHKSVDWEKIESEQDAHFERKRAQERMAMELWQAQSERRRVERCPQLDNASGRIHETHLEIPVVYGYLASGELMYVSYGGLNIMPYMSPNDLHSAQSEVACLLEDEQP